MSHIQSIANSEWKETVYGKIPTHWMLCTVRELMESATIYPPIDGNHGEIHPKLNDFVEVGIPFITAADIINGHIDLSGCKKIKKEQADSLRKGFSIKDDVLLTHKATIGRTAIAKDISGYIMLTPQVTYYRIKDYNRLNNIYLKYFFDNKSFQELFFAWASSGSTRDYLGIKEQQKLLIIIPPIQEQRAIAGVLSSLDDKIDLLHRQNKTLEGMAEALWRKMFVEEADPGWIKGKLGDEMAITMGQSPPGSTYNEEKRGVLFFQGRAEFGFRFPKARLYCSEPKRLAQPGDTLVSVRAPVGDINMALEECCIGRGLAAVKHRSGFNSYTFYKIKSLKDDFDCFEQQGTVFGSIGKDEFNSIDTFIPDIKAVKQFNSGAKLLDDKIYMNSIQIRTLSRLRDTLLPKLMSGEVRVCH